jgi:hypothetical protein
MGTAEISTKAAPVKPVIGRPFLKGQSGNPGGRPPVARIRKRLMQLLRETIDVERPGPRGKKTKTTITKERALVESIFAEAIGGPHAVAAFTAIADRIDGRPVSMEDQERVDRSRAPSVTVNLFQVLGTLPEEALAKLEQAAVEAEAVRVLPPGDE